MSETVETWRYQFPSDNGEGWAIIFMDSIGCFTALSDWGNVAYRWPQGGWGVKDFRKFVLDCGDDYLTDKFGYGRREYDPETTLKTVKAHLDDLLERRVMGVSEVEEEHEALRNHSDLDTREDFALWLQDTKILEPYFLSCQRINRDVTQFVAKVMPRLREKLKEELKKAAA